MKRIFLFLFFANILTAGDVIRTYPYSIPQAWLNKYYEHNRVLAGMDSAVVLFDTTASGNWRVTIKNITGTQTMLLSDGSLTGTGNIAGATYGSDGTVSNAELLYINSLSSNAQDQLDARCLESVFGTAIGTGLTLDGTTLKTHASLQSIAGLTETNGGMLYGTADNAYAWLAAGATTEILVGGGAAAPVWTTATGTGAPVRAGSPTLTGTPELAAPTATTNAIGTAQTIGLTLQNTTAAAAGAQQYSPMFVQTGYGHATTPVNSQRVDFGWQVVPVQGALAPTGQYNLYSRIASGSWSTLPILSVLSSGSIGVGLVPLGGLIHAYNGAYGINTSGIVFDADGNSGIYSSSDNVIGIAINGSLTYRGTEAYFSGSGNYSGAIFNTNTSYATLSFPSVGSHKLDPNTGLGGDNADHVSLVAGGEPNLIVSTNGANVLNTSGLASESLTNGALTGGTSWLQTGDFALTGDKATYTHSTGTGTIYQETASLAIAGIGSRWYKFTYTTSSVTGTITMTLTTSFTSESWPLYQTSAGAYSTYFKSAAIPANFTIQVTTSGTATISLDNLSLTEVNDGDLFVRDDITAIGTVTSGGAGQDGQIALYGEQGTPDYTVTLNPNVAMTSDVNFYLPADEPAGTYLLNSTTGGVLGYTDPSTLQPAEATLTDIADGTIAEDLVNTANPWADNEVADNITASNYQLLNYYADTSAVDDNWGFTSTAISAYATGLEINVLIGVLNTDGATLQINALGTKAVTKASAGSVATTLATGDIIAGQIVHMVYDGTRFQVLSRLAQ